jgi:predicted aspartyl protease
VREFFCWIFCVLLIFSGSLGRVRAAGGVAKGTAGGGADGAGEGVPFQVVNGFLIVFQGRIGTYEGLNFLLDTGTTHSTVSRRLAQLLRVPLHTSRAFNFDRFIATESGVFPDIEFGPVHVRDISMVVEDPARLSDFAKGVDVIIGSDLLSLSNFSIDYDARKLFFAPVQAGGASVGPHPTAMMIELRVQGRPVDLLVDTGLAGVVLFEDRLRQRVPELRTEGMVDDVVIGWQVRAKQAVLNDVRLGGRTEAVKVYLLQGPRGDVLPGVDGYWGTATVKARRINFDFGTNRLSWQD